LAKIIYRGRALRAGMVGDAVGWRTCGTDSTYVRFQGARRGGAVVPRVRLWWIGNDEVVAFIDIQAARQAV
jgi:hypothetical protein